MAPQNQSENVVLETLPFAEKEVILPQPASSETFPSVNYFRCDGATCPEAIEKVKARMDELASKGYKKDQDYPVDVFHWNPRQDKLADPFFALSLNTTPVPKVAAAPRPATAPGVPKMPTKVHQKSTRSRAVKPRGVSCYLEFEPTFRVAKENESLPVLLIGGMGPLAGAEAFSRLLTTVSSPEIVCFQASTTPDRTTAVVSGDEDMREAIIEHLRDAILLSNDFFSNPKERKLVMVSCNTAHIFFFEALRRAELINPFLDLVPVSLLGSTVVAIRHPSNWDAESKEPVLLLGTSGSRKQRIYSSMLEEYCVPFTELTDEQQVLMDGLIYKGIKAGDVPAVERIAVDFVHKLLPADWKKPETRPPLVVAGCTEIPAIFEIMNRSTDPLVREWSSWIQLVDPFFEAAKSVEDMNTRIEDHLFLERRASTASLVGPADLPAHGFGHATSGVRVHARKWGATTGRNQAVISGCRVVNQNDPLVARKRRTTSNFNTGLRRSPPCFNLQGQLVLSNQTA